MAGMIVNRFSLALLMTGAAALPASAADRLSLSMSGHFSGFVAVGSQDDGAGEAADGFRDFGIARESEIRFQAKTTLDNGLKVGVRVELEGETSGDQIDESYIWFDGAFGRIEAGSTNGAAKNMWYGEPNPILRHGLNDPSFSHVVVGGNAVSEGNTLLQLARDRDKVAYYSPRVAGFQVGVSYTPDRTEELGFALRPDSNPRQQSEIADIAVNYVGEFGPVEVVAYAGFLAGNLEVSAPGREDQEQWGFGAAASYAGFTVGGSYRHNDLGTAGDNTDLVDAYFGIEYRQGPWSAGVQYGFSEAGAGSGLGDDKLEGVEVGGTFSLGPGITLSAGVQWFDFRDNLSAPGSENSALIGVIGTHIKF